MTKTIQNSYLKKLIRKITLYKIKLFIIRRLQIILYFLDIKSIIINALNRTKILQIKKLKKPIFLYDLRCMPLTFDIADYLMLARIWIQKCGYSSCEMILFANEESFRPMKYRGYSKHFEKSDLFKRVENILIPMGESADFISQVLIISKKDELNAYLAKSLIIYPPYYVSLDELGIYSPGIPSNWQSPILDNALKGEISMQYLNPRVEYVEQVNELLEIKSHEKLVTFTARDYEFESKRNSNYKYIKELSLYCQSEGYRFILIPDNANQFPEIEGIEVFRDASIDLYKRISIYQMAQFTIGTAGGPTWMARYITNTYMFITQVHRRGNEIGFYADLRSDYGRKLKWGEQPFEKINMQIIWGPEDNINKLLLNKKFMELAN